VEGYLGLEEKHEADPQHKSRGQKDEKPHHPAKPQGRKGPEAVVKHPKPHPQTASQGDVEEGPRGGKGKAQEVVAAQVEAEEEKEASQIKPKVEMGHGLSSV
jgi:hypothetical protein